jgi:hypothetical protein
LPQRDLGLSLLGASRPLIEFVLRNRAMAIANIGLRTECRVTEIVPVAAGAAVRGVRFDAASGGSEMLEADLVVDASRGADVDAAQPPGLATAGGNRDQC